MLFQSTFSKKAAVSTSNVIGFRSAAAPNDAKASQSLQNSARSLRTHRRYMGAPLKWAVIYYGTMNLPCWSIKRSLRMLEVIAILRNISQPAADAQVTSGFASQVVPNA